MAELNDWVTPWFDYGVPYWGKPPLAFWVTALGFKLFGVNEFTARLPHLAISLLIFGAMSASAQTRSFYNERGSFAGQSFTRGNSTSFSDGQGRFSGSAIRHGNSTSFYDGRGRFTGSVVNTGPKRPRCAGPRGDC